MLLSVDGFLKQLTSSVVVWRTKDDNCQLAIGDHEDLVVPKSTGARIGPGI
jgi:hypothetical protein